jgi:outer membrane protein
MKKTLLAIAALTALTSGAAMAQQQDGKWMVRMRAVHIDSSNGGSTNLIWAFRSATRPFPSWTSPISSRPTLRLS